MTKQKKLCPYWVWSKESNVHVVESLNWFTEFTPFKTKVERAIEKPLVAIGVGTVYLSMRRTLEDDSPAAYDTFRLENVLCVPAAVGNVVGGPIKGLKIQHSTSPAGSKSTALVKKSTGDACCYFYAGWEDLGLLRVAVDVNMQCDSFRGGQWLKRICKSQTTYKWPKAERAAWLERKQAVALVNGQVPVVMPSFVMSAVYPPAEKLKELVKTAAPQSKQKEKETKSKSVVAQNSNKPVTNQTASAGNDNGSKGKEPLTNAEETWMKTNFGSEYDFLSGRGLFMNSDLDRQKGRQLLRSMIDSAPGKSAKFSRSESDQSDQSGTMHFSGDDKPSETIAIYGGQLSFFEEGWLQENFGSEQQFFEDHALSIDDLGHRRAGLSLMRDMMAAGYPEVAVSASMNSKNTPQAVSDKSPDRPAAGGEEPVLELPLIENSNEASTLAEEICLLDLSGEGEANEMPINPAAPNSSYPQAAFSLLD